MIRATSIEQRVTGTTLPELFQEVTAAIWDLRQELGPHAFVNVRFDTNDKGEVEEHGGQQMMALVIVSVRQEFQLSPQES